LQCNNRLIRIHGNRMTPWCIATANQGVSNDHCTGKAQQFATRDFTHLISSLNETKRDYEGNNLP
jgi:hypothetical protein